MNSKDFNELVEARCSKIKATLASKGKEYSTDDDKLHNFNKAGIRSGQSREKALMGMKLKHEISIDDIILNLDKGRIPTIEVIDEKIGDIINYFVLLEACLVDRIMKEIQDSLSTSVVEECYNYDEQVKVGLNIERGSKWITGGVFHTVEDFNIDHNKIFVKDENTKRTDWFDNLDFIKLFKKVEENSSKFLEGQIYTWWSDDLKSNKLKLISILTDRVILQNMKHGGGFINPSIKTFKENYRLWKEDS